MQLDQAAHQGKAYAQTAIRACALGAKLRKYIEGVLERIRWDPGPGIRNDHANPLTLPRHRDCNTASRLCVVDAVGQQIADDLGETMRVAVDRQTRLDRCDGECVLPCGDRVPTALHGALDDLLHLYALTLQLDGALIDATQV